MTDFDVSCGTENIPIHLQDCCLREKLANFQYVCCNIPAPGMDTSDFEDTIQGCTCTGVTCDMSANTSCTCMKYGPTYTTEGRLITTGEELDGSESRAVFLECNSQCSCPITCYNRVVQRGINTQLHVSYTEEKGFGLNTVDPIKCGTFVCEYAGEILNEKDAKTRARQQKNADMNYIFVLREHVTSGVLSTFIDPSHIGNIGRFINHSCEPNLCIRPVRVHNLVPRVCLFAARDIRAGEELLYSYGTNEETGKSASNIERKLCLCGTKSCTRFLPCDRFVLG